MIWAKEQAHRYERVMGVEALRRQRELAARRHVCCWEPKDGPHHEMCRKYQPDVLPEVHAGQVSLI